ncbi:MAG: hypothetical protein R6U95_05365 [Bacteroidales bacterium]
MKSFSICICCIFCLHIVSYSQYIDLPHNLTWTGGNIGAGTATIHDIESAFNTARYEENSLLQTNIPAITFPKASVWKTWSPNAQALWLINQERSARGLMPFEDTAQEVISVAQDYANYLFTHDTSGHYADGFNPNIRLRTNKKIDTCMDAYAENIGHTFHNGYTTAPTHTLERMIFWLIYEDSIANWGHRRAFFTESFIDDSGESGTEGLLGTGFIVDTNYTFNGMTYDYAAISVFNIIDPQPNWEYSNPEQIIYTTSVDVKKEHASFNIHNEYIYYENTEDIIKISVFSATGEHIITTHNNYASIQKLKPGIYFVKTHFFTHTKWNTILII